MPTVTLNRKVFDKLVGKHLPDKELRDRMAMIGTDVESVDDKEIVVEIFPNRPDMLSEQGFARAFKRFLGLDKGLTSYKIEPSGKQVIVDKNVVMRPYTACAIVKGLILTDEKIREIMQVQEKLATTHGRNRKKSAYGVYPLDVIEFPVQYTARAPESVKFRPLGFEEVLSGTEVLELHPKAKAFKHLTKGWKTYPFFIDANKQILSMLPFTNSHDTGKITEETSDVFVECSGTDLNNVRIALRILVSMLADMGGKIYSIEMVYDDKKIVMPDFTPKTMELDVDYANKILGLDLSLKEASECLERMGYDVKDKKVSLPSYRADILHQRDLVEDIAIAYGYENFEEEIPEVATIAKEDPFMHFQHKIAELLIGFGMMEVTHFHLIDKEAQTTKMGTKMELLHILDPVSQEYNSLRAWLLPGLLNALRHNKVHEYPQKMFELGVVFKKDLNQEALADEFVRLACTMSHAKVSYTEIRQILDALLRQLEIEYEVVEVEHSSFLAGRVGRVIVKDGETQVKVAYLGEVHPQVLENFGLEMPTAAFELNLTEIWKIVEKRM